jgi:hypothetical protein
MKKTLYDRLVAHINRKNWWHSPPVDPKAYRKRGMFLSSSYAECEFYGRPLNEPKRVTVSNPLVGDEKTIERKLFGHLVTDFRADPRPREEIFSLDAERRRLALSKGYDSIVLMSPKCFAEWKSVGKIPRSIELNVLEVNVSGGKSLRRSR